ncbi:DUF3080 family protein [Vibrio sp. SCSIO 43136]|uniref:DUF3080 family protein n=1 Tax=Vibrio sp. SCSIO 43136 TaxID=2819101 RepID=UPI00207663E4|nr:DUF3080 family protein [Vibrio sp. SCSIO 43136]USD64313.1 DUF3080 domain-containing protein [Vibrio sp. SCSIO 43136]
MKRILVITSVFIAGCSDPTLNMFQDYIERIARVQEQPVIASTFEPTTLPPQRALHIDIEPVTIGLLDSYQLRKCGLFGLIADRNSILGKVQDQFRLFDYQRQLIAGIEVCLASGTLTDELETSLKHSYLLKQAQLNSYQHNLLLTSKAMQKQLGGQIWLTAEHQTQVSEITGVLEALNLALSNGVGEVAPLQEQLEKLPVLGRLDHSLQHATHWLNLTTRQLRANDSQIHCGKNRDRSRFTILNNVFNQGFVAKIQPYLAELDSYYYDLEPNLNLFQPPMVIGYTHPISKHHQEFRQATLDHVQYWQGLFKRCGRTIGQ